MVTVSESRPFIPHLIAINYYRIQNLILIKSETDVFYLIAFVSRFNCVFIASTFF